MNLYPLVSIKDMCAKELDHVENSHGIELEEIASLSKITGTIVECPSTNSDKHVVFFILFLFLCSFENSKLVQN